MKEHSILNTDKKKKKHLSPSTYLCGYEGEKKKNTSKTTLLACRHTAAAQLSCVHEDDQLTGDGSAWVYLSLHRSFIDLFGKIVYLREKSQAQQN